MFKNPVVKFIAMFIIGFIVMVAVQWLVSIIKSTWLLCSGLSPSLRAPLSR